MRNLNPTETKRPKNKSNHFPRIKENQVQTNVPNLHSAQAAYIQAQTNTINTPSRIKTPLLPPLGSSQFTALELRDKILGIIYGAAIGDAIGIATENMTADECRFHYLADNIQYRDIVRDEHRVQWRQGDWTVDFDQIALVLESILHWGGVVDELDFAQRLAQWSSQGFKELGDTTGFVISSTITKVVNDSKYTADPHSVASQLFESAKESDMYVDNGALSRAILLGVIHFHNLDEVVANSVRLCKATHVDARCLASSVMIACLTALLLQGKQSFENDETFEDLVQQSKNMALNQLQNQDHVMELNQSLSTSSLLGIDVHNETMRSHTFTPIAVAIATLRNKKDFRNSILDIVMNGADSNTYACITGSLLGFRCGYSALPQDWLEGLRGKQVEWLDGKVNLLLDMMGMP